MNFIIKEITKYFEFLFNFMCVSQRNKETNINEKYEDEDIYLSDEEFVDDEDMVIISCKDLSY